LKGIIAAPPDILRLDEKHIREYAVPNVVAVIITTNHKVGGIFLPADDRRHHVSWSNMTKEMFAADYFARMYHWFGDGGNEIVAHYLRTLDVSRFRPAMAPPQTEAFWAMVNANRSMETGEMADRLDALGQPDVTTLERIREAGLKEENGVLVPRTPADWNFNTWLCDRKNSRAILYRLEECGYEAVRNPDAKDGLWRISEKRQAVYGKHDLPLQKKLAAAGEL
jgi:hypothetical protein